MAVGVRAGLNQPETPDTHGLASGGSGRSDLIFSRFWAEKLFAERQNVGAATMASPSKPYLPAQAEGSMPEGLRDLFGFSEQDCE